MELPTGVLAYRLLKSANVSDERQQLARATLSELTYENMKKQLKAIFDNSSSTMSVDTAIKVENTFQARYYQSNTRGSNNNTFW